MKAKKGDKVRIKLDVKGVSKDKEYDVEDIRCYPKNGIPDGIVIVNDDGLYHHFQDGTYDIVSPKWGDPVAVRDLDCEEWTQGIYVAKDPTDEGYIVMIRGPHGEYVPEWCDQCKLRTTVTKQEIADWKNVPVELLNIES